MPITIKVNGEDRSFDDNVNISKLLEILNVPARGVAVVHNRKIISKARCEKVIVEDGDELELIRFVGGG